MYLKFSVKYSSLCLISTSFIVSASNSDFQWRIYGEFWVQPPLNLFVCLEKIGTWNDPFSVTDSYESTVGGGSGSLPNFFSEFWTNHCKKKLKHEIPLLPWWNPGSAIADSSQLTLSENVYGSGAKLRRFRRFLNANLYNKIIWKTAAQISF